MRLFSAIELPDGVRAELADRMTAARAAAPGLKWIPREQWHITLGFYGDGDDPGRRGAWLREQAAPLRGFRLRLRDAGRFSGVLWIGGETPDAEALQAAAGALTGQRAGGRAYTPHVTVARWKKRAMAHAAMAAAAALAGYRGPWWLADEVVLFSSELTPEGPVYTAVDRVALSGAPGKQR
jgi:RNA 2',3'-cyclic 3'-phosphodiesterase